MKNYDRAFTDGNRILLRSSNSGCLANPALLFRLECVDEKRLEAMIIPPLRSLLFSLDRMEGLSEKVKMGLRVLKGFISRAKLKYGDIEMTLDVPAEEGTADSGDLEADLPELMLAVGHAAASRRTPVVLILDEMQYLGKTEMSVVIIAMHKISQKQLPSVMFGEGLPPLLGNMGNSKSYAERLFHKEAIRLAVEAPIEKEKAYIERRAIDHIATTTQGYPYFVQQWAHDAWNCATGASIDLRVAQNADSVARKTLDEGFFSVRFDRLTTGEKIYLRAMAYFATGAVNTTKIAPALGQSSQSANSLRSSLIKKGMIYSPSYGDVAFTVPLFDQFIRRKIPNFTAKD